MIEEQDLEKTEKEEEKEELEEEYKEIELTWNKKIVLIVTGILFYLIFLFIFFPYSTFIRYILTNYVQAIKMDYSELEWDFPFIIVIKDLYLSNDAGTLITGDSVRLETGLWDVINLKLKGNISVSSSNLKIKEINTRVKGLKLNLKLDNSISDLSSPSKLNGDITTKMNEIFFEELWGPLKAFSLPEEQRSMKDLDIFIQIENGKFSVRKFNFKSELFDANLTANGSLASSLENSTINGKVCFKPKPKLEELNPVIYNLYITAGGSLGGEFCIKLEGSFSNLKFQPQT